MTVTSVRIQSDLESPLEKIAQQMRRSKSWIINEALRHFIQDQTLEEQRWKDTLEGLEDIRMGRVVDGDKVHAWLESLGTENELPSPFEDLEDVK